MVFKSDVVIHTPRKRVWDIFADPNQIGLCVQGTNKNQVDFFLSA
jgi:hypothetical protein